MRLICPNCDAQYEVDDTAIPREGRDVQCSACGHAWYQLHPDAADEAETEDELYDPVPVPAPAPPPPAETPPEAVLTRAQRDLAAAGPPPAPQPPPRAVEPPAAAPLTPPRRQLDETLLAVLREEAAREAAVRRAEAPRPVETQPDLGLSAPPRAKLPRAARAMPGQPPPAEDRDGHPDEAAAPPPKRELLPDIEEINYTLRPSSERRGGEGSVSLPAVEAARSGFRSGFLLMVLLAGVLVLAYVMAPRIALQLPGAAPLMASYVERVDALRLRLDRLVRGLAGG